ncbi:MAG TPA: hypothetical protein VK183_03360 [Flavobacterium sp.]|nr:hypothetical protein [Flavobacterium sp.]
MKTILVAALLWFSLLAFGQTTQPVYVPPQAPPTPTLPKADPVPTTPAPAPVAPRGVRATDANKVEAVPSASRADFESEMASQQKGSTQRTTSAQPADFDAVTPAKDPDPQVQPPKTRD